MVNAVVLNKKEPLSSRYRSTRGPESPASITGDGVIQQDLPPKATGAGNPVVIYTSCSFFCQCTFLPLFHGRKLV